MEKLRYNWNIFGHEKQLASLERDLVSGNLPHAYLFAGPPKIGKYTLAGRLAKILQCDQHGCGECQVCINISKGYHPDTFEMTDDGETIKIEPMRDVLKKLATTTPGNHKILLIKNIERMTPEAANALLKTLEEPGSSVVFLFTTSQPESVLATVLSRVRLLKFQSISTAKILEYLKDRHPLEVPEKLSQIADLSFGLPGRALRFMEDPELLQSSTAMLERIRTILRKNDLVEKFSLVSDAVQEDEALQEFFDIFLLAVRYTMLEEAEKGTSTQRLQRTLGAVLQAQEVIRLQKRNINARLLFENLMLLT